MTEPRYPPSQSPPSTSRTPRSGIGLGWKSGILAASLGGVLAGSILLAKIEDTTPAQATVTSLRAPVVEVPTLRSRPANQSPVVTVPDLPSRPAFVRPIARTRAS